MRPAEGVRDDALAQVGGPEAIRVDHRGVAVGEELVADVPVPDLAAEAGDLRGDVLVQQVAQLGIADRAIAGSGGQPGGQLVVPDEGVPPDELVVGLGERDELVRARPVEYSLGGPTTCHFISLPGVTRENWPATMAARAGMVSACGLVAVPIRSPVFSASSRRESGSLWSCRAPSAAADAVPAPPSATAAPAAPAARTLRRLTSI